MGICSQFHRQPHGKFPPINSFNDVNFSGFETLLHLSAHLGFSQFTKCLLDKPGADSALALLDRNGKSPLDIAHDKGLTKLAETFAR